MIIRPIGQSGYLLKSGTTEILIDPYLSDVVNKMAGRPRLLPCPIDPKSVAVDGVICTHDHADHLDPEAVAEMPKEQFFITTREGKEHLSALGQTHVTVLAQGETLRLGDLELTAVFADHTVEAFGLIVRGEGHTLYFSGDTLYNEKLFEIAAYRPDVTFICINGRLGNMNVEEALTTARRIGAKVNIPTHYDMFASNSEDPHRFADHIHGGKILEFDRAYDLKELVL